MHVTFLSQKYMFSDDESDGENAAGDLFSPSSDDDKSDSDADDFLPGKTRAPKRTGAAKKPSPLESEAESDKSDVQATRALIQKLSPVKATAKPGRVSFSCFLSCQPVNDKQKELKGEGCYLVLTSLPPLRWLVVTSSQSVARQSKGKTTKLSCW